MKKKILAAVLTGTLFLGISEGTSAVYGKGMCLTLSCETNEKETAVMEEILKGYEEETGTAVKLISGESDILVRDFASITELYKKEQLCNLYPYMEKESPYSKASTWEEALPKEIRDRLQIHKREIPGYPASRTVVRMFCNEEFFQKAGVDIPETWDHLIDVCKKLHEEGFNPLIFPGKDSDSPVWQWVFNYLCNQMDINMADSLDETEERYVELAEACKGIDKEVIDYTQPQMQEAFRCLKELYDFSIGNDVEYEKSLEMFADSEAAIIFASSEDAEKLKGDFGWNAVPVPVVTNNTSEYAAESKLMAGGEAVKYYGISASLIGKKDMLDTAVDFVQYMTSEKIQEKMAAEAGILPSAKDAELPEEMNGFQVVEEPLRMTYFTGLDEKNQKEIWEYTREYLANEIEIAVLTEKLNQSCQEAAQRIREENGWTLVNNYGMPTSGECTKCAP